MIINQVIKNHRMFRMMNKNKKKKKKMRLTVAKRLKVILIFIRQNVFLIKRNLGVKCDISLNGKDTLKQLTHGSLWSICKIASKWFKILREIGQKRSLITRIITTPMINLKRLRNRLNIKSMLRVRVGTDSSNVMFADIILKINMFQANIKEFTIRKIGFIAKIGLEANFFVNFV